MIFVSLFFFFFSRLNRSLALLADLLIVTVRDNRCTVTFASRMYLGPIVALLVYDTSELLISIFKPTVRYSCVLSSFPALVTLLAYSGRRTCTSLLFYSAYSWVAYHSSQITEASEI
jgi:hypothetical protein